MVILRSVSLHISKPSHLSESLFNRFLELSESVGDVWTRRAVLPEGLREETITDLINKLDQVDLIAVPFNRHSSFMMKLLEDPRIFVSLPLTEKSADLVCEISKKIGEGACTQLGFFHGSRLVTPYFPVTKSTRTGFSSCMRVIPDMVGSKDPAARFEEISREVNSLLVEASAEHSVPFLGIDLSISPWMEESCVDLMKVMFGVTVGEPGTISAIWEINRLLSRVSKKVRSTGFNELMLPYAEDDGLMRLAKEGRLRARDLVAMVSVCVAGLDMVVIPRDLKVVRALLRDVRAIAVRKRRSVGVRVIPTEAQVGEEIKLERFTTVPVMSP